ncbi:BURP domain-containing protein 5-like [Dendrobium catenatum]|uniref:BURP domain-containing protein 5-like n=1 Tax=Dendrobium catenatum TaxID=906689 RepID=UPI00109EFEE8|nr:BURP domain-containing protein 5-like [Dendrobium catenatum]
MAKATPFSSTKLTKILGLFNITRVSIEAKAIQQTLEDCEEQPIEGEIKRCVTSLEDMADFVKAEIGNRDVNVIETTVKGGVHQLGVPKQEAKALVSCHPVSYPKAVYNCHTITNVEAYKVHLLGSNGVVVDAAAICHLDTSAWAPHYLGFKILKENTLIIGGQYPLVTREIRRKSWVSGAFPSDFCTPVWCASINVFRYL